MQDLGWLLGVGGWECSPVCFCCYTSSLCVNMLHSNKTVCLKDERQPGRPKNAWAQSFNSGWSPRVLEDRRPCVLMSNLLELFYAIKRVYVFTVLGVLFLLIVSYFLQWSNYLLKESIFSSQSCLLICFQWLQWFFMLSASEHGSIPVSGISLPSICTPRMYVEGLHRNCTDLKGHLVQPVVLIKWVICPLACCRSAPAIQAWRRGNTGGPFGYRWLEQKCQTICLLGKVSATS